MGLEWTHKQELKMSSTCRTKKRRQLVQVEWKWCGRLNRDNLKHKLYILVTFGRRHHSPPYNILCASPWGLHPNVTFPRDSQMRVPKLGLLLSQNFGRSYFSQIKFFLKMQGQYLIAFKTICPMVYNTPPLEFIRPLLSRGLWS
jgi:hypothetical protein